VPAPKAPHALRRARTIDDVPHSRFLPRNLKHIPRFRQGLPWSGHFVQQLLHNDLVPQVDPCLDTVLWARVLVSRRSAAHHGGGL